MKYDKALSYIRTSSLAVCNHYRALSHESTTKPCPTHAPSSIALCEHYKALSIQTREALPCKHYKALSHERTLSIVLYRYYKSISLCKHFKPCPQPIIPRLAPYNKPQDLPKEALITQKMQVIKYWTLRFSPHLNIEVYFYLTSRFVLTWHRGFYLILRLLSYLCLVISINIEKSSVIKK